MVIRSLVTRICDKIVTTLLRRKVNVLVDQTELTGKCADSYVPHPIVILLRSIMLYGLTISVL